MIILSTFLQVILTAFLLCLMARAVFSWIEPYPRNKLHRILFDITEPLIAPVRRVVPPIGGVDL
ncbi:MAG: YggT family protein, partial [Candidatus Dormibacteraceae bacterium]